MRSLAAWTDTMMISVLFCGPLSLTLTIIEELFLILVIFTTLGKGRVLWAAISAVISIISLLAVFFPWVLFSKYEAWPISE